MTNKLPQEGELFEGQVWFERKGKVLKLGLTSAALDEIGDVESIDFPIDGKDYSKDEVLAVLEGSEGSYELLAPSNCVVTVNNEALESSPSLVSEDPLEEGWILKIEIEDLEDIDFES